ncbi:pentatricopeptide repeat-containing protein [Tripterygium wilfordii]|uniref:Pentatricopeptide repeat-containing protein n=1 Tax=Tripterygium wilfordii TaxID=458696 RepID=A0A7J7BWZ5_TRIWF|nr:pentatricopeptide repeat-containing protein At1g05670, mitochondrial-like [Tripterygium wilfordii]KAF5726137.1 pentatricopeptide repeat-containing protein [Tripterygium wilfordii]
MAMLSRSVIHSNPQNREISALASSITSLLQTLNPTNLNSAPLNQFSPFLEPELVINVIKKQPNPYHALFFFNWASNPNPNPNNYSHTHPCYVAITDLLLSHFLFSPASSLLQNSQKLSDLMYSKFIKAYGDMGDVKSAVSWFHKAKNAENGRCLFSYNAVLGVYVKANQISVAKNCFDQMVYEGVVRPDVSTYTTMLRGFCKMGMIEDARKMFDEMACKPNSVTYNTMISGFCKKGDMDNARMIFTRMKGTENCVPNTVTYTTLIDGYCKKDEFDEAMKYMKEMMASGCKPSVLTYNAVIYSMCLRGKVDEAKKMMTKMRLNGLKDNVATNSSILKGLCVLGRSEEAVKHFKEMIKKGMKPEAKTYDVIVIEYCKIKKPEEAISLLKEMKSRGVKPSVSSFNALLRVLVGTAELDRAISTLKQMPRMGCSPNFMSYSTVICGLCMAKGRMQEVEDLLSDMLRVGHRRDATMYSCLIMGYCKNEDDDKAVNLFNEAIDEKYVVSLESFSVLVRHLCSKGKEAVAEKIFKEMNSRCCAVDVGSYRKVLDEQLVTSG